MLGGNPNRHKSNSQRLGAHLVTAKRIVVDELEACHAVVGPDILNVDINGTPSTTCYTSLSQALDDVRDNEGGTVINLSPGCYELPAYSQPLKNCITFSGDDCPVVGVAYVHCARRNDIGIPFTPDFQPDYQGSGQTTLTIANNTITVSMGLGGSSSPDFTACASLVGKQVALHSINSGPGSGVISVRNITGATSNTITFDGVSPFMGTVKPGEGFVILPSVKLTTTSGTIVKGASKTIWQGIDFSTMAITYLQGDDAVFERNVLNTQSQLFIDYKSSAGTAANTILGSLNFAAGSQNIWSWGAVLGSDAEIFTESNTLLWIFSANAGAAAPLRVRNGATADTSGSDWFNCITGPDSQGASSINIQNNFAKECSVGYLARHFGSLVVRGLENLSSQALANLPASVVGCSLGFDLAFSSLLDFPNFSSLTMVGPLFNLPVFSGNTVTLNVDFDAAGPTGFTGSFGDWISGGFQYGAVGVTNVPGFSHANIL